MVAANAKQDNANTTTESASVRALQAILILSSDQLRVHAANCDSRDRGRESHRKLYATGALIRDGRRTGSAHNGGKF